MKNGINNKLILFVLIFSIVTANCSRIFKAPDTGEKYKILFISPVNGEKIKSSFYGTDRIQCRGRVQGKIKSGFKIKVKILTDIWYPQGTASVKTDGTWELSIYLGGKSHKIKAELVNPENKILAKKSIKVIRVKR